MNRRTAFENAVRVSRGGYPESYALKRGDCFRRPRLFSQERVCFGRNVLHAFGMRARYGLAGNRRRPAAIIAAAGRLSADLNSDEAFTGRGEF